MRPLARCAIALNHVICVLIRAAKTKAEESAHREDGILLQRMGDKGRVV